MGYRTWFFLYQLVPKLERANEVKTGHYSHAIRARIA